MKLTTSLLVSLITFLPSALTAPVNLEARDVYAPPVLYPHQGTVWIIGQHHNVTWDASSPPVNISNGASVSLVQNGRLLATGPGSIAQPMAKGFDLRKGRVEVQVPSVTPGTYQIVLFGDSGNWGQPFTITN